MKLFAKVVFGAIACMGSVSAHAVAYQVTNLGSVDEFVSLFDINNSGQIAGTVKTASGADEAALWSNGAWTLLSPSVGGRATGINDHGHVVGASLFDGQWVATLWKDGAAQLLPRTANLSSNAFDINNAGQIVGSVSVPNWSGALSRPAIWSNGGIQYLDAFSGYATGINDRGQIVGAVYDGNGPFSYAATWTMGKQLVLGAEGSEASAINERGTIVGQTYGGGATLWGVDAHPDVTDRSSGFFDINEAGVAVGYASFGHTGWGSPRAMIWRDGQAYDLNELVAGGLDDTTVLTTASAINDKGQIVGFGASLGAPGYQAFLLTPVPEPAHWAMLLVGLGLVGVAARRKA